LLCSALCCRAVSPLLTRKLAGEDVHTTLFFSALVGVLALTPLLPWSVGGETLSLRAAGFLLLLGLLAGLGHWAVITAHMHAPASMLTPYSYLQMVWATGYGYLIFRQ